MKLFGNASLGRRAVLGLLLDPLVVACPAQGIADWQRPQGTCRLVGLHAYATHGEVLLRKETSTYRQATSHASA